MARSVKRHSGRGFVISKEQVYGHLQMLGPAHAVYFATYEIVKHAMGGSDTTQHHPLAAGWCIAHNEWHNG